MAKVVVTIKIDPKLKRRLAELAQKENRSLSNLIETICHDYAIQKAAKDSAQMD
jgi:predicted transcriptional regulator